MKLPLTCMVCVEEIIISGTEQLPARKVAEFNDEGQYKVECEKGHKSTFLLQEQKFELLFDIGAYAILDGYYREAISSFSSALERFYEFSIRVLCRVRNVDWSNIIDAWNDVSSQSERQLGAFIFIYLQEFGNKPIILGKKDIELRNKVIHKGKIPSREEAIKYGQSILNIIRPIMIKLKEDYSDAVGETICQHLKEISKGDDSIKSTMTRATILSLSNGDSKHDELTLEEALQQLRHW